MTLNKRVAIIGAGGIGSFFCDFLSRDIEHDQFGGMCKVDVTVYDFDVVEEKNLRHQNFTMFDIPAPKALVMTERYGCTARADRFVEEDLYNHDMFIICADNPQARKIVYKHCKTYDKPFLDMRTEGEMIAILTHNEDIDKLLATLGEEKGRDSIEGRSCQRAEDVANNTTQHGNYVVSALGIQTYLDMYREKAVFKSYIGKIGRNPTIKM